MALKFTHFGGVMSKLLLNKSESSNPIYSSKDYKRTRAAYISQASFEYFVALVAADSFLAILLNHIGFSDSLIGIISSLVTFAFLFELITVSVANKIRRVKPLALTTHLFTAVFATILYLAPFFNVSDNLRTVLVASAILIRSISSCLMSAFVFKWSSAYIEPKKRASFGAIKEKISLVSGIIVSLGMGYGVDKFKDADNINGAFILLAVGTLIFGLMDVASLLLMKNQEDDISGEEELPSISAALPRIFKSKPYRRALILNCAWYFAYYMTNSFIGIYKTKDLLISLTLIETFNFVGIAARYFLSSPIGKYSDKTSYAKGIRLGLTFGLLAFVSMIFTAPSTWWIIVAYTIFLNISGAGTGHNFANITFDCVEEKYFVHATAIKSAAAGLTAFFASIVGGAILDRIQQNGNVIFGIHVMPQQVLAAISALLTLMLIFFCKDTNEDDLDKSRS